MLTPAKCAETEYPISNKEFPMMRKDKTQLLTNDYPEITWILDIPCWILDIPWPNTEH